MHEWVKWINENSNFVQAASSVVSLLITFFMLIFTIIYVRATQKLVHLPHKALVKPTFAQIGKKLDVWILRVKNYGPGLATNVKVKTRTVNLYSYNGFNFLWQKRLSYQADGSTDILSDKEENYYIKGYKVFESPVYIEWESISGKRYRTKWRIPTNREGKIKKASLIFLIKPFIRTIWDYIKLPSILIKDKRTDYSYLEGNILRLLSDNEFYNNEIIAEKLKINENIQSVLWKMHRKGYIAYDGDDAQITEAGNGYIK